MYRKIVPIVCLACSSFTSFGQASTLTAANYNPQLNDAFISVVCDTSFVSPGLSGPGISWSFISLSPSQIDTARDVPVTSTAGGSYIALFAPTTNVAVVTPTASMTTYGIESATKLSSTGYYQSAAQYAIYTDPMDQIQYPCTYNTTFTDTYAGTLYIGGTGYPEAGSVTSTCDGWGTLILPGGLTYSNVLRVHSSQTYTDNADLFHTGTSTTFDVESYNWYMPGYHSALLTISTSQGTGIAAGYFYKIVSYAAKQLSNAGVHSVPNISSSLQLFPNPVQNVLNVNFDAGMGAHVRIDMTDMLGRDVAVIANQYAQGVQNFTYNTSNLPKGLYIVRLQSGDEHITKQVVVQ
jgi:hypothetical protein